MHESLGEIVGTVLETAGDIAAASVEDRHLSRRLRRIRRVLRITGIVVVLLVVAVLVVIFWSR